MKKFPIMLTTAVILQITRTAAEPATGPAPAAVRAEVKQMCREAIWQLCDLGFPPDADALRRCALENQDKLPAACRPLIATFGGGR